MSDAMGATRFAKVEACGNDFVLVDQREAAPVGDEWLSSLAITMCASKRGIGADGLLVLAPPSLDGAGMRMRIFNADGSEGLACGNGLRCVGAWLDRHDGWDGAINVEVGGFVRALRRLDAGYGAEMGEPGLGEGAVRTATDGIESLAMSVVSMGNLHALVWGEYDLAVPPLASMRAMHESLACEGLGGVNLSRVHVTSEGLVLLTREAGAGFTLSCGSASCAAACGAIAEGRVQPGLVEVRSPGGVAGVRWSGAGACELVGPARVVFEGAWEGA